MTKRLLGAVFIALLALPLAGGIVQFNGVSDAADDYRFDNFNRASLGSTDWYDEDTNWSIESSTILFTTARGSLIHKTDTTTIAQWVCLQFYDNAAGYFNDLYYGPKARFDDVTDPDTGDQYTVRIEGNSCTTACNLQARSCSDWSCSDIAPELDLDPEIADGDWVCFEAEGTSASTVLRVWHETTTPCDGAGSSGPSYLGDPDFCIGDSTSSIPDCDCGGNTTCYDSVGVGCANTPCLDGNPNYADCAGANCYVGIYSGGQNDSWMDDFCGGSS